MEGGLAKAGVETISIWSDPKDDCSLFMCLGFFDKGGGRMLPIFWTLVSREMTNWWWFYNMFIVTDLFMGLGSFSFFSLKPPRILVGRLSL